MRCSSVSKKAQTVDGEGCFLYSNQPESEQETRHYAGSPFLLFGHKAVTGLKCRYFSEVGNAACCAVDGVA